MAITAGLHYLWGGRAMDQDRDGVRDGLDQCPNTLLGATVDAHGCPHDADGDGVLDGLDKCNDTPKGCKIDAGGCSTDAVTVGVGDGVLDGLDKCNDTPKGATIDANGCQSDADGDGVFDGLDKCPNTPSGLKVDVYGCPIEVSEKETQLLDTGTIRLQNIEFDTNKATIKPESYPVLEEVARILQQYPTLEFEIGGHTDNTGDPQKNIALSEARADSVLEYLRSHYPGLPTGQYKARGYGAQRPIAPNSSLLGRARNRRVEFRVTNTDVLRIERERRRFLRRGEPAPGTAPPSPPSDSSGAPGMPPSPAPADTSKAPVIRLSPAPADTTKPH